MSERIHRSTNSFFLNKGKQHYLYIALLLVLVLLSTIINQLPEGFIIAHGDHAFFPEITKNYPRLFYLWGNTVNGDGAPVGGDPSTILQQGFFYVLDSLGVSDTQKQNTKYFLFLFLSGISAYLAVGLFFRDKVKPLTQFIVSIFYAFNGLTVLYVSYIGAYLTVHDLHIFLPLIWALFVRGLMDRRYSYLVLSTVLVFFSVGGFQNPAFLLLFLLLLLGTVLFLWLTRMISLRQVLISFAVLFSYLSVIGFYSFHLFYYLLNPPATLRADNVAALGDMKAWIEANARPVIDNFRFVFASVDNFPDVFPYTYLPKEVFVFLSFYPAFFMVLAFLFVKNRKDKIWLIFFGSLYLIIVLFTAKQLLLKKVALFIFTLPIFNVLRSWDKFMALLPFVYAMALSILLRHFEDLKPRMRAGILIVIAFIILVYPLPFFVGKFHVTFNRSHLWGYRYNTMVKMPQYYKNIARYVNKDTDYYKIVTMPYGGEIGKGWVLYPKWKYIGVDFTTLYLNNPTLSPVETPYQFGYARYLQENPKEGKEVFLNLVRIKGVRYLIVNKDVGDEYIMSFNKFFAGVRKDFVFVKSFGNLDLYKIMPEKELPVLYAVK